MTRSVRMFRLKTTFLLLMRQEEDPRTIPSNEGTGGLFSVCHPPFACGSTQINLIVFPCFSLFLVLMPTANCIVLSLFSR